MRTQTNPGPQNPGTTDGLRYGFIWPTRIVPPFFIAFSPPRSVAGSSPRKYRIAFGPISVGLRENTE